MTHVVMISSISDVLLVTGSTNSTQSPNPYLTPMITQVDVFNMTRQVSYSAPLNLIGQMKGMYSIYIS